MHEGGIAERILELALARARAAGAERINAVHLEAGPDPGLSTDAVALHWLLCSAGTEADGAQLTVTPVDEPGVFRLVAIDVDEPLPAPAAEHVPAG